MSIYWHHVVGFFSKRVQVERLFSQLIAHGIPHKHVRIFDKYSVLPTIERDTITNANLLIIPDSELLINTGLESLVDVRLFPQDVSLIVESELVPQLVALGWGIGLGVVNTNFYTREEPRSLANLVHDAVLSKQFVIVVEAGSPKERAKVSGVIRAEINDLSEIS